MLRTSRRNSKISAYEGMAGPFNYNKTPMAPLGTKGLAFVNPGNRASWQMHANDVFYIGREPQHYCLLKFFDNRTKGYTSMGTYKLFPLHCKVPTISEADLTL